MNEIKICKDCNHWLQSYTIEPNQSGWCRNPEYIKVDICTGEKHLRSAVEMRHQSKFCGLSAKGFVKKSIVEKKWYHKIFGG